MQHHLDGVEVGDDPVFQGTHGHDAFRGLADHGLGFSAHAEGTPGAGIDGHHTRLGDDDAFPPHVDEGVGSPEIDAEIAAEHPEKLRQGSEQPSAPLNARGTRRS